MRVFLGGLWPGVRRRDLDRMVREALRGPWYRMHTPRGQMTGCELLELQDRKTGHSEYCAVIEVEPNRLGWEVVQHLDGAHAHGYVLSAHRWFERKGMADRRTGIDAFEVNDDKAARERRTGRDRRRALDVRPLDVNMVTAMSGFQRTYGA